LDDKGADSRPTLVLGAGLTGLAAAHALRNSARSTVLAERDDRVGGKARSHRRDGHTFDVTGHWLHLRHDETRALVDELFAADAWVEVERRTVIHSHGATLAYPFQANLHGLPLEVVQECLVGFIEARERAARGDGVQPRSFGEFAEARFGAGIARHFFVPYNTKLWGRSPDTLTADWVDRYIPIPDPSQLVGGALGLTQRGLGYNASFRYPRAGGIDALPEALRGVIDAAASVDLRTGSGLEELDLVGRRAKLAAHPDWLAFGALINTIPLPELVARVRLVPDEVREAASALRWVRWRYLDLALSRPAGVDYHWSYVPDPRLPFFRVGVYSNAVASMAPRGGASLYVELNDRERAPDLRNVYEGLASLGVIDSADDVRFCDVRDVEYAYVIFDDAHAQATATIQAWLRGQGVHSCGRYGAWTYNSMEDSMLAGRAAARWAEGWGERP
jgi:protoporphyrinogen oxidase